MNFLVRTVKRALTSIPCFVNNSNCNGNAVKKSPCGINNK